MIQNNKAHKLKLSYQYTSKSSTPSPPTISNLLPKELNKYLYDL